MKIFPKTFCHLRATDAKEMRRQGELAFTMVEIAIAIGVIGFALVAIIGILPTGMGAQKDNREDTVISQDAPYFLDAIRNGVTLTNYNGTASLANIGTINQAGQGLDFLTNYVQGIRIDYLFNGQTNSSSVYSNFGNGGGGAVIIGLLSTPQSNYNNAGFDSNYIIVTATNRALSGPATAQQNKATGMSSFMAFTYKMEVFISPFNNYAPATTAYANPNLDVYQSNICFDRSVEAYPNVGAPPIQPITVPAAPSTPLPITATNPAYPAYGVALGPVLTLAGNILYTNYPVYNVAQPLSSGAGAMTYNLFDVRLRFSWPVLANGTVGPGRQTYRTLVSAQLVAAPIGVTNLWYFQPQSFTNVYPNGL